MEDLELLENLSNTITETALCGLGQSACKPVQSTLRYFRQSIWLMWSTTTARSAMAASAALSSS